MSQVALQSPKCPHTTTDKIKKRKKVRQMFLHYKRIRQLKYHHKGRYRNNGRKYFVRSATKQSFHQTKQKAWAITSSCAAAHSPKVSITANYIHKAPLCFLMESMHLRMLQTHTKNMPKNLVIVESPAKAKTIESSEFRRDQERIHTNKPMFSQLTCVHERVSQ